MYLSNDPRFKHLRKEARSESTIYEKMLWQELRAKKFYGYKFRRQHQILRYYLDFYCHEAKLGIEIDGSIHDKSEQKEYDELRTEQLRVAGVKIIRFTNDAVQYDIESVLASIYKYLVPPSS